MVRSVQREKKLKKFSSETSLFCKQSGAMFMLRSSLRPASLHRHASAAEAMGRKKGKNKKSQPVAETDVDDADVHAETLTGLEEKVGRQDAGVWRFFRLTGAPSLVRLSSVCAKTLATFTPAAPRPTCWPR